MKALIKKKARGKLELEEKKFHVHLPSCQLLAKDHRYSITRTANELSVEGKGVTKEKKKKITVGNNNRWKCTSNHNSRKRRVHDDKKERRTEAQLSGTLISGRDYAPQSRINYQTDSFFLSLALNLLSFFSAMRVNDRRGWFCDEIKFG